MWSNLRYKDTVVNKEQRSWDWWSGWSPVDRILITRVTAGHHALGNIKETYLYHNQHNFLIFLEISLPKNNSSSRKKKCGNTNLIFLFSGLKKLITYITNAYKYTWTQSPFILLKWPLPIYNHLSFGFYLHHPSPSHLLMTLRRIVWKCHELGNIILLPKRF